MRIALDASAILVSAHHHDLCLIEALASHHADTGVSQLMKPHILVQANGSPCPSDGRGDAMRSNGEQSIVRCLTAFLCAPEELCSAGGQGDDPVTRLAINDRQTPLTQMENPGRQLDDFRPAHGRLVSDLDQNLHRVWQC